MRQLQRKQMLRGNASDAGRVRSDVAARSARLAVRVEIHRRQTAERRGIELRSTASALRYYAYRLPELKLLPHVHLVKRALDDLDMPAALPCIDTYAFKPVAAGVSSR